MMIGEIAARTDTKIPTVRFYEQIGLLRPAARTPAFRRTYGSEDLRRLSFIRHARQLGFDIAEIRSLLGLADEPARDCGEADAIASAHLANVHRKIARLQALREELARMVKLCRGGRAATCGVLEVLADHGLCAGDHRADAEQPVRSPSHRALR